MARLLIDAITNGDMTLATCMVHRGLYGCIDSQTWRRDGTALFFCCSRGYYELACLLMDRGASLSATDKSLATPLHGAVDNGHLEIVRLLIMRGAQVNAQTVRGDTPLHLAAYRGYGDICRCLVEAGADPQLVNVNDLTPQREAFSQGHLEISSFLMKIQEMTCPEKSRYRASMIQLDPPSDLDMTFESVDGSAKTQTSHGPCDDPHAGAVAKTGLPDLPDKDDEERLTNFRDNVQKAAQSFITLDPPVDDVVFIRNVRAFPECQTPYMSPEHSWSYSGIPVQPKTRTPDVSLGQKGHPLSFQRSVHERPERRSKKLNSGGDTSDFSSDSYSTVSTASDVSDCFDEIRPGDCEMADGHMSANCGCGGDPAGKPVDGYLSLQHQLSFVREAPRSPPASHAFSEFSDVFDSTVFSMRSLHPSSSNFRVSEPPPSLRYDASGRKQRPASVNSFQESLAPERPSYNKSFSVEFRPRYAALGQDAVGPKSGHPSNSSSFNDLSSNYLSSSSLASPSSSMTCINIPIN